jgi:hypothetical protein
MHTPSNEEWFAAAADTAQHIVKGSARDAQPDNSGALNRRAFGTWHTAISSTS